MNSLQPSGDGDPQVSAPAMPTDNQDEHARASELSAIARQQTDEQFSAFYRESLRQLVGFLLNHGAAMADAAEVAQETMTRAYRQWDRIEHPRARVHTVASRELARKIADDRETPVGQVPTPTVLLPRTDALTEWEQHQDILRQLRCLPPRQRQVLAWTLDGFAPSEIAEQLGLTAEAVRSNLVKARRAMAEHFKGQQERR